MSDHIVVAIDGYSSCGKSTLAKALAKKLIAYKKKMALQVNEKAKKLDELGYKKYLESK